MYNLKEPIVLAGMTPLCNHEAWLSFVVAKVLKHLCAIFPHCWKVLMKNKTHLLGVSGCGHSQMKTLQPFYWAHAQKKRKKIEGAPAGGKTRNSRWGVIQSSSQVEASAERRIFQHEKSPLSGGNVVIFRKRKKALMRSKGAEVRKAKRHL